MVSKKIILSMVLFSVSTHGSYVFAMQGEDSTAIPSVSSQTRSVKPLSCLQRCRTPKENQVTMGDRSHSTSKCSKRTKIVAIGGAFVLFLGGGGAYLGTRGSPSDTTDFASPGTTENPYARFSEGLGMSPEEYEAGLRCWHRKYYGRDYKPQWRDPAPDGYLQAPHTTLTDFG